MKKVLLRRAAESYLKRLPEPDRGYIKAALKGLERKPPCGDIKHLEGTSGMFRLRIGKYRALYKCENNCIFVTNIDPRGQAYKKGNIGKR